MAKRYAEKGQKARPDPIGVGCFGISDTLSFSETAIQSQSP